MLCENALALGCEQSNFFCLPKSVYHNNRSNQHANKDRYYCTREHCCCAVILSSIGAKGGNSAHFWATKPSIAHILPLLPSLARDNTLLELVLFSGHNNQRTFHFNSALALILMVHWLLPSGRPAIQTGLSAAWIVMSRVQWHLSG